MKRGFTLLEVMIAMAILAMALVAIMDGQGSAMVAARKSRSIEVLTLLAREKMELLSLEVERTGFTDEKETECDEGTFAERGRDDVRWKACVVKVEMNLNVTDMGAITAGLMGGDTGEGEDDELSGEDSNSALAALGLDATMLGFAVSMLPMVTEQLAQAIRRLELTINWTEIGLGEQSFRLILYVTDPARATLGLEGMMGAAAGAGAGASGTSPAPGTPAASPGSPILRPGSPLGTGTR